MLDDDLRRERRARPTRRERGPCPTGRDRDRDRDDATADARPTTTDEEDPSDADLPVRGDGPHRARGQGHDRRLDPGGGAATDPPEGVLRHQDLRAAKAKKAKTRASAKKGRPAEEEVVHDRQDLDQAALHLHPPALDAPGRRPADPPEPEDPRGPVQAGRAQELAGRRRRGHRERPDPLRGVRQAPQGVRPALLQHDQGRRGRRCPRGDPPAPGRLQGEVPVAQAADQVGDGLPDRGHLRRLRDRRLHPLLHHPQVRGDLQGLRRRRCRG